VAGEVRRTVGTAARNHELVRDFLAAWERRDTAAILERFADRAEYHAVPLEPIVGKEALRTWVEGFAGVPPGRLEVRNQVAGDTVVMNERVDRITIAGNQVTLPICAVFEIDGDQITSWREYFDMAGLRKALQAD
jgi:limonene-1,2-epoxide hydrolase